MGDPGLHSKFVEMQQEEFQRPAQYVEPINPYVHGLLLDRSRLTAQIERATNLNYITMLTRALDSVNRKLNNLLPNGQRQNRKE